MCMSKEEKERIFMDKAKDIFLEIGKVYEFDCPICGQFAMGFKSAVTGTLIASCANCQITCKKEQE